MIRSVSLALLTCALGACASPTGGGPGERRPTDLAGFIEPEPLDYSTKGPADLASSSPPDLAGAPADLGTGSASCGSITYAGTCTGDTLSYCDSSSTLQTIDCAAGSRRCTTVSGDSDCRFVAGEPCGSIGVGGVCDGDHVVYCGMGVLVVQDCSAQGFTCLSLFGYADCI